MMRRLVRGDIVTPGAVLADGGLLVADEVIEATLDARAANAASATLEVDDRRGCVIFPGAVDAHVHSFSDVHETFVGSTRAAAAGGVTTIIDMPYDEPEPANDVERILAKIDRISGTALVDVALHGTVAPGAPASEIAAMVDVGVCGFKVSMFETDPRRFPRIDHAQLREILIRAREVGVAIGVHAEDGEIIRALVAQARREGRIAPIDHCRTRPTESETTAVAAGAALAAALGAPFHIFHASAPESVEIVTWWRSLGADLTAETCPHYLVLDDGDMGRLGAMGKINPPLRTPDQVERNWELLASGGYDMVTSDHAPWGLERKAATDIFDNASGAPGVQTLLPLVIGKGWLGGRLGLLRCAQILAEAPAQRFGLARRKGRLVAGADADYVVLDPAGRTSIRAETQYSHAGWTPYEGLDVPGRLCETVVRGRTVYVDGELGESVGVFVPGQAA